MDGYITRGDAKLQRLQVVSKQNKMLILAVLNEDAKAETVELIKIRESSLNFMRKTSRKL